MIKHYKGVCHGCVDSEADLKMAEEIAFNSKCQRPGVCNAWRRCWWIARWQQSFCRSAAAGGENVELRADDGARRILESGQYPAARLKTVADGDYFTEYSDYILNVRVVDGLRQAIDHVNHYGSMHSDSIVTRDEARANQFLAEVDSAAVYWNASTRFTDGGEFGMGAEIGISTDKVGARGPMGLEELTSYKWVGIGTGQLRT